MNISIPKMKKTISLPKKNEIVLGLIIIVASGTGVAGLYPFGTALSGIMAESNIALSAVTLLIGAARISKLQIIKSFLTLFLHIIIVKKRKFRTKSVKALTIGVSTVLANTVCMFWSGFSIVSVLSAITEAFLMGYLYFLFWNIGKKGISSYFAEMIAVGIALSGIYGIKIPYIDADLAVLIAILLIIDICSFGEVLTASMSGLLLGFLLFINTSGAIETAGIFGVSAMVATLMSNFGKTGTAGGFLCGMTVSVLIMARLGELNISDIFAAPILFLFLPSDSLKIGEHINSIIKTENTGEGERIATKLRTVAKAVCDLGEGVKVIYNNSENNKDAQMFNCVANRLCDNCKYNEMCFRKESKFSVMKELKGVLEKDGFLSEENIPKRFRGLCIRREKFMEEFSHMYELYKQDALHMGETVNDRDIIAKQYGELSNVITLLSEEIEDDREEREDFDFSAEVCVCQEAKDGVLENGDSVVHFRKNEKYYVILCDGMGAGKSASEESSLTAHLFEEFLKAGIEKQSVISIINSTLALKVDRESFSSVDLLEINLETGEAEFLKIGSAQSYIKRDKSIETVVSTALPIGILENIEVKGQKFAVKKNDVILMISDGVGDVGKGVTKGEWIKKILLAEEKNDFETAQKIINGAKVKSGEGDDITSIIIRIKKG